MVGKKFTYNDRGFNKIFFPKNINDLSKKNVSIIHKQKQYEMNMLTTLYNYYKKK